MENEEGREVEGVGRGGKGRGGGKRSRRKIQKNEQK